MIQKILINAIQFLISFFSKYFYVDFVDDARDQLESHGNWTLELLVTSSTLYRAILGTWVSKVYIIFLVDTLFKNFNIYFYSHRSVRKKKKQI